MNSRLLIYAFFSLGLLLCAVNGITQSALSSTTILRSAWSDPVLQAKGKESAFFENTRLDLPRLEELEFRTETHEFDPELQEYALRLKLNSGRQLKAQRSINAGEQRLRQLAEDEYLEDILFDRYQLLVEAYFNRRQERLLDAQAPWFTDWERLIQQRIAERGERSYDDWLKLQDDELVYRQKILLSEQKSAQIKQQCTQWLGETNDTLSWQSWPTIATIQSYLTAWQSEPLLTPLAVQSQVVETELVVLELEAEKAETRNRLNFLQLRYQGDNNPVLREQLTLGAGVTLPFRNAANVKQQYLELERIEEENRRQEREQDWLSALREAEAAMAAELETYKSYLEDAQSYQTNFAPQRLLEQGVRSPEVLLRAQGGIFKRQQLVLEQEQRVYEAYLDLLLLSGHLIQRPLRNWLSVGQEVILE